MNLNGAVHDIWDSLTASWSFSLRRQLKEEGIDDFLALNGIISKNQTTASPNKRVWKLESNLKFSVKSLLTIYLLLPPSESIYILLFGRPKVQEELTSQFGNAEWAIELCFGHAVKTSISRFISKCLLVMFAGF